MNEKLAVWPLATVWLEAPDIVAWKSKPIPESGAVTLAARAPLETVKVPLTAPAPAGVKDTPVVQLALAASVCPQALFTSLNPEETDRFRSVNTIPTSEFMTVRVTGELVVPTPVVGKFTRAGTIWTTLEAGGSRPVPFRATVRPAFRMSETVNVPVCAPGCVGVKTTRMEQLLSCVLFAGSWVVQLLSKI